MSLSRSALKHPYAIFALALVVAALGAFAFFRTPTDLFPDTVPPRWRWSPSTRGPAPPTSPTR